MTVDDVRLIDVPRCLDPRGNLSFVENSRHVPFDIKRVYWVYDVPGGESRGAHAHKEFEEFIVAASGSFKVTVDDGSNRQTFLLNKPYQGLLVRKGIWRDLTEFSSGAVCLVMTTDFFTEDDYIRNYDDFLRFRGRKS